MSTSFDGRAIRSFSAGTSECPPASTFASGSAAEQLERVLDRLGHLVVERCGDHCLASSIARQTRSGVAGIWISVTPRCESASSTALITAGAAAIVPGLPHALRAERMVGRLALGAVELVRRQLGRRRHEVGRERAVREVAVLVVDRLLVERRRDALRDAAVHLAVDDQRVDDRADVVDRDVADEPRVARLRVDLDDRRVGAAGPREVRRVVRRRRLERRLHPVRAGCGPRTPPTRPLRSSSPCRASP